MRRLLDHRRVSPITLLPALTKGAPFLDQTLEERGLAVGGGGAGVVEEGESEGDED